MNLLTLRYFCCIAEKSNMTVAAQSLSISQPALSKMMKALEAELGCHLFIRKSTGLTLTAAGTYFYEKTSHALNLIDESTRAVSDFSHKGVQELHIFSMINPKFLPDLYLSFRKKYPEIRLVLERSTLEDISRASEYDFSFCTTPNLPERCDNLTLFEEELVLAVPHGHPLCLFESISLQEAAPYEFITLSNDSPAYRQLLAYCFVAQFTPKISMQCDTYDTFITFMNAGKGIALIPMKSAALPLNNFHIVHIREPLCLRSTKLCFPSSRPLSAVGRIFLDHCIQYTKKL